MLAKSQVLQGHSEMTSRSQGKGMHMQNGIQQGTKRPSIFNRSEYRVFKLQNILMTDFHWSVIQGMTLIATYSSFIKP